MGLTTVRVPEGLEELFRQAEEVVSRYFRDRIDDPSRGTIEISGERYVLVRAASLSVEFFTLVRSLFGGREQEADDFARNILFDHHLTPLLTGRGYRRDRRTYRRFNRQDDCAIVNFEPATNRPRGRYQFYVNFAVVPRPWVNWVADAMATMDPDRPGVAAGMLTSRLDGPLAGGRWEISSPESAEACAAELATRLPARLDNLDALLDRPTFLRLVQVRDGHCALIDGTGSHLTAEVVLLVERGMTPRLAALLRVFDERERAMPYGGSGVPDPHRRSPFALWAEAYAAANETPDD